MQLAAKLAGVRILVIDQAGHEVRQLKQELAALGAQVFLTGDFTTACTLVQESLPQVVLVDVDSTEGENFEDFQRLQQKASGALFFLASQHSQNLDAGTLGVHGVLGKPWNVPDLVRQMGSGVTPTTAAVKKLDPLTELLRPYLIFRSNAMRKALAFVPQIAQSSHSALLTGETGTGKEMVAMALHRLSPRKDGPFVAVNCGAIPESLIEGELFGHEKGAFTGAMAQRKGKFELAQGGTLFLDEMGEMPLLLQARLLRVLEEKQFYRIGGEKPVSVDVRVLAATQVNLYKAVRDRLFREDLLYRLNVFQVHLPPLRERTEDVPVLAWHFLERALKEMGRNPPFPSFDPKSMDLLSRLPWPGNVRELRNLITRLAVLLPPGVEVIRPEHLALYFPGGQETFTHPGEDWVVESNPPQLGRMTESTVDGILIPNQATLEEAEAILIQNALQQAQGNRTQAAKKLGIGLRTLRRKLNEGD